ncbi:MAG: hypothetical protein ACI8RD_010495 [Bacillariaceae sp.]|jgi:hypothetical protein
MFLLLSHWVYLIDQYVQPEDVADQVTETRPAQGYFRGTRIETLIARITFFSRTSPCSRIITKPALYDHTRPLSALIFV